MWFSYALVTIIFYVGLDFFVKRAAGKIDDFVGTIVINFFSVLPALIVYIWLKFSNQEILITKEGLVSSVLAGLSIGIGTITFLKMFSSGANISLGSPIVRIGTVLLAFLIGVFVLKEGVSPRQVLGFIISLVGLGLLVIK